MTKACIGVATKATEITGGQGYLRDFGLEKLFRDVQASKYHPMPEKDQYIFRGEYLLKD